MQAKMVSLRKITVTTIRERSLVFSSSADTVNKYCEHCQRDVSMASAVLAARMRDVSLRTICRWVESQQVHFSDSSDGLFICLASLTEAASERAK